MNITPIAAAVAEARAVTAPLRTLLDAVDSATHELVTSGSKREAVEAQLKLDIALKAVKLATHS